MMYTYMDYFENYGRIMQFNKNKTEPLHRWYPFVEGYSKEFIQSIINEMSKKNLVCLEPFSGSGTTALELQNMGIECYSFEVNPFMFLIAKTKLENGYIIDETNRWFEFICEKRNLCTVSSLVSDFPTLYEGENKKKWNLNKDVAIAVDKLKQCIRSIENDVYKDLFSVALASILLDVSNLYRNGKCLSYRKDWKTREITEQDVFLKFDNKVKKELLIDIGREMEKDISVDNKSKLFNIDSRIGIEDRILDESIDLVITSPPYLNSRDYTDTYMLELKTLEFVKTCDDIRNLREQTLRSHVQIKWQAQDTLSNTLLKETLIKLNKGAKKKGMWNDSIIDMVRLYFVDMQKIFNVLYRKIRNNGKVYFNVSNSAYFDVLINTLEICASIAEDEGFSVIEIRKARELNTSPQQQSTVGKLLEGVIVLEKKG